MSLIVDPTTLSPSAWYRSSDITGLDGASVSLWTDATTNGRDLVQATAGNQPKAYLNQINGYRGIKFDGTDDYLATSTGSSGLMSTILGASGIGTSIVVFATTGTTGTLGLWSENSSSGSQYYLSLDASPQVITSQILTTGGPYTTNVSASMDMGTIGKSAELQYHVGCWQHSTSGVVRAAIDNFDT